jgi:hypothetical protein
MAYFQTQTPNLGKFWRVLQYIEVVGIFNGHFWYIYGHLVYLRPFGIFTAIWYVLGPFGIFCGHLVYFLLFAILFPVLVCCTKGKSGNHETRPDPVDVKYIRLSATFRVS